MRNLIKVFFQGVVSVMAALSGVALFTWIHDKITNPVERKKLKKKIINVKNAIMKND